MAPRRLFHLTENGAVAFEGGNGNNKHVRCGNQGLNTPAVERIFDETAGFDAIMVAFGRVMRHIITVQIQI
jgi:hypothetical protein